jgi:rhodanese-related sulfurtransferase
MTKKQSGTISKRMAKRAEQRRKKRQTQIVLAVVALVILAGGVWAIFGGDQAAAPAATQADSHVVTQDDLSPSISVDDAYKKYQAGAFLLDVRTQEEWDDYHIPNTTLIPMDDLGNRVDEVPQDQEVVVVCRSGNRSQAGREILISAGFTQVTSMDGGVNSWRESGYPTE